MALGITRVELNAWKEAVLRGEIAFLTHYWTDIRFPDMRTVTKAGCADLERLSDWCRQHGLNPAYIHRRDRYPHFDLFGPKQIAILQREGLSSHIARFRL